MREFTITDADATELRTLLDSEGLTDVTLAEDSGVITVGVLDSVDGVHVDTLVQRYVSERRDGRVAALAPIAALTPSEGDVMRFSEGEWQSVPPATAIQYKEWAVLLTQSGTDAPVPTELKNTLGAEVVLSRTAEGDFRATSPGAFPAARTIPVSGKWQILSPPAVDDALMFTEADTSGDFISIVTTAAGVPTDGLLGKTFLEIRVYDAL